MDGRFWRMARSLVVPVVIPAVREWLVYPIGFRPSPVCAASSRSLTPTRRAVSRVSIIMPRTPVGERAAGFQCDS